MRPDITNPNYATVRKASRMIRDRHDSTRTHAAKRATLDRKIARNVKRAQREN